MQWLTDKRFGINRMHRGDLRFLLEAPCNLLPVRGYSRPFYVEIQQKKQAVPSYKLGKVLTHGVGLVLHREWQTRDVPVWLLIAEVKSGELLALKVNDAEPDTSFVPLRNVKGVDKGGMAYFRKSRFALLAELSHPEGGHKQLALNGLA